MRLSDIEANNVFKLLDFCIKNDGQSSYSSDKNIDNSDTVSIAETKDDPMSSYEDVMTSIAKIDHYVYDQFCTS